MSLKNIFKKSLATLGAISLVFGNCSLCGVGISKVIAETTTLPEIASQVQNKKYVQYKEEEISGVAIYSTVSVYTEQEKDTYMPTESVEVGINLPSLNGYMPQKAIVAEAKTKSTTGEELNTKINQNYDSNSGLLNISYKNESEYSEYKKNAKDEFEIIYIYQAEAYTGNEEETKLEYTVNTKISFEKDNEILTAQNTEKIELVEKDNKGDITNFEITQLKEKVYKGFLYSNVENKTKYDTEYKTVSTFCVLNSDLTSEIKMSLEESKFILNDEEETQISSNGNVIYKATGISKYEFDKILGQDGVLEIYIAGEVYATVKYIEVEGSKKLAVIYSDDNIKILEDGDTAAIVEYAANTTSLEIKISKPVAEGFIHFENQNAIKAAEDYGNDLEEIKYIFTKSTVNKNLSDVRIELLEPKTKVTVTSSNSNFSTLQTSKTTLTIKLDDTNASTKLFNNPTIVIKLPEGLTGGNLSSPEILNGNGLKLKDAKANKNIITLQLEGKQTAYDTTNVSGGVSIVMDIENIDFDDTLPTHEDKIEVSCTQGKEITKASCNVNIVSKYGLLMLSKVTGYSNNGVSTSIDSNIKNIEIAREADSKEVVQTLTLVNNYNQDLEQVQIIGEIGYSDDDVYSTFDTNLVKEIKTNKSNAKVYYNENKDAKYNDNTWKEEFSTSAKLYKVVLEDNKLSKMDKLEIQLVVTIPEKLEYNQSTFLRTEVYYTYNGESKKDSSTTGFETEKIVNQLATISAQTEELNIESVVESGSNKLNNKDIVYEGQVLTYRTSIQNTTNKKIENIVIKANIPEGTTYTKLKIDAVYIDEDWFEEDATVKEVKTDSISLNPNEVYTMEYEVRVNDIDKSSKEITQNAYVLINDEISYQNTLTNIVNDAEVIVNLKYLMSDEKIISAGESIKAGLEIINLTSEEVKGNIGLNFDKYNKIENVKYITYTDDGEEQEINPEDIVLYPNEKIYFKIIVDVNWLGNVEIAQDILRMSANFKVGNKEYLSNTVSRKITQTNVFLTYGLTGYVDNIEQADGATIKNDSQITYKIEVKNIGSLDAEDIRIIDELPNGLVVKHIKYTRYVKSGNEYITEEVDTDLEKYTTRLSIEEYIPSSQILNIFITCDIEDTEITEISNIVNVEVQDEINYTGKLTYKIQALEEKEPDEEPEKEPNEDDSINAEQQDPIKPGEIGPTEPNDPNISTDSEEPGDSNTDKEPENPDDSSNTDTKPENPDLDTDTDSDKGSDTNNPSDTEQGNDSTDDSDKEDDEDNKQEELYSILGVAWLDLNKDGKRDENEKLQQSVIVTLVNKQTGNFALDTNGNKITTVTDSNGKYEFNNLSKGSYIVLFEFDTNTYTVTTYQKNTAEDKLNSDAIMSNVKINGENKLVAITDSIDLSSNKENIDIGLIENAIFDLSLEKSIVKTSVINSQGTEEHEYEGEETVKVDLVAKYINTANVVVTYKFTVTNNGEVTGYVDSLIDDLPSGLEFDSELNTDWYKGNDGRLYTTALSGISIKPGESKSIELVLTKNMTEDNVGVFPNNAELEKISNLENIQEKEDALENNKSSAMLVISIKTGSIALYTGITLICILIITLGTYFIKKKVLNRGI